MATFLVWFRDDLRLGDHPALTEALHRAAEVHGTVLALYVLDGESAGIRPLGGASRWWLHSSLERLAADLDAINVRLVLRRGPAGEVLPAVLSETGAEAVYWNRRYGGPERTVDAGIKAWCEGHSIPAHSFAANLLHEPWTITTGSGGPFRVYTPFWRACSAVPPRAPLPVPDPAAAPAGAPPASDRLADWNLLPGTVASAEPDWAGGLRETWAPGEAGASERLADFFGNRLEGYGQGREQPSLEATSRLSPHLRFGEVSPFQVWAAISGRRGKDPSADLEVFAAEIGWREFCWHLLYHQPDLGTRNFRPQFDDFPWADPADPAVAAQIRAWQRGVTGIPLVDAGMRQMWQSGWMHNRVRMVTASLLTKNLRVDWRIGEAWFWDALVDADAASNVANWQWVAGSGADASPYFRIFNPVLQSRKFDPEARYLRRYLPELAGLDSSDVHEPWKAEQPVPYPPPVVDLKASRQEALDAYGTIR